MITISLCMIVRDEEPTLERCLDSIKDSVDEIIIVDTGSIDKTKEIAGRYTSNIYDFKWIDDFSAARNYSFSKATQDFVLWLDADDVILEEDRASFKLLKEQLDPSIDIVMMKYNIGSEDSGSPLCTFYRERLLKRSRNYKWQEPVHECIDLVGKIVTVDIAVTHRKVKGRSSRNLKIFERIIGEGKELSHRNQFYYARELYINNRYDEAAVYYNKFLDEDGGLFSNYVDACIDLSRIYTLKSDRKNSVKTLIRCFEFGIPRGEICCEIGSQYKEMKDYEKAIYWYDIASKLRKPENMLGSLTHDCYNYIPYAEMSVCYFNMGMIKEAVEYNEKAALFRPDSQVVNNNRRYFNTIIDSVKKMI